jgi:hypothetical protein
MGSLRTLQSKAKFVAKVTEKFGERRTAALYECLSCGQIFAVEKLSDLICPCTEHSPMDLCLLVWWTPAEYSIVTECKICSPYCKKQPKCTNDYQSPRFNLNDGSFDDLLFRLEKVWGKEFWLLGGVCGKPQKY